MALSLSRAFVLFASASLLASPALAQGAAAPSAQPQAAPAQVPPTPTPKVAAAPLPAVITTQPTPGAAPTSVAPASPAQAAMAAARPAVAASPVPPPTAPQPTPTAAEAAPPPMMPTQAMASASGFPLGDLTALESAIAAAKRADATSAQAAMAQMGDPAARKAALWMIVDADGEQLPFATLQQAQDRLNGWPRVTRRQQVTEKAIVNSGLSPSSIISWFSGNDPITAQGAMALAGAYQASGRNADAQALIRHWWDDVTFDADTQRQMLARFGGYLTLDDHAKRASTLLYLQSASGLSDVLAMLPPDQLALAQARQALRNEASNANALVAALPPTLAKDPGLAVDSARYLMSRNLDTVALELVGSFPTRIANADAASRVWTLRRQMINSALKSGAYEAAYAAAANTGMTSGADAAEAEFYAGWIAFSKLHDPRAAETHFAAVQAAGTSPMIQGRALYWRGRAAEARGDTTAAQAFYNDGARYLTTFYGQLAAGKAGMQQIALGHDPVPTADQRSAFDGRDMVRAARMLQALGERDLFRIFMLNLAEQVTTREEYAMTVDLARLSGDQDMAMRVIRLGAQHGYVLPDRGYPIRNVPDAPEGAEPAMVFGITRQESGFDPFVRSPVGARGMMQLMPRTAETTARRIGQPYSAGMLDDPEYNMRLGSAYLGHMVNNFNGSMVMAAAAYNAGPGRPLEWITYCGDPRAAGSDPADFVECIPFSETRNYVMRVMEATEVYRARLNGGVAPLSLASDLKRGGYAYARAYTPSTSATSSSTAPVATLPPIGGAAPLGAAQRSESSAVDGAGVIDASTPARPSPGFTVQGAVP